LRGGKVETQGRGKKMRGGTPNRKKKNEKRRKTERYLKPDQKGETLRHERVSSQKKPLRG